MSLIAKEGEKGEKILAPTGTIQAVCFDVWDLFTQETDFMDENGQAIVQHKIKLGWELEKRIVSENEELNGKRFRIYKDYTLSLSEKSTLRKDLESWLSRPLTKPELKGFNLESLVGINCLLSVVHKQSKKGNLYAVVGNVVALPEGMKFLEPETKRSVPNWIENIRKQAIDYTDEHKVTNENGEPIPF